MRIGIVMALFDTRRGGAERWTYQLARWLVGQGHELHFVARRWSDDVAALPATIHVVPFRSRWRFAAATAELVDELKLDIVHDMGCGWRSDVFQPHLGSVQAFNQRSLRMRPLWYRMMKIATRPLLPRYHETRRLLKRQFSSKGTTYIALSQMVARDFAELHGVPRERIEIIHNGVDTVAFSPSMDSNARQNLRRQYGVKPDDLLLLLVAHNPELKGLSAIVKALSASGRAGFPAHLVVVGGSARKREQGLIERLNVQDQVHFAGTHPDVRPFYQAADAYVHPTYYDACSLTVLEAMAAGLPVITTCYNGAGELVPDGAAGFVLDDPGDWATLAQCLLVLHDEGRLLAMAGAARRRAEQLTLERNFETILRLYDKIVAARSSRQQRGTPRPQAA